MYEIKCKFLDLLIIYSFWIILIINLPPINVENTKMHALLELKF